MLSNEMACFFILRGLYGGFIHNLLTEHIGESIMGLHHTLYEPVEANMAKTNSKRCIVVLGMHRSGTSLLTNILNTLGVHVGKNLMRASQWNEAGYWEMENIHKNLDAILRKINRSWFTPNGVLPFPENWWREEEIFPLKRRLIEIIREELLAIDTDLCGFKDPRTATMLPLWQEIFKELNLEPIYILAVRDPLMVAASTKRRDRLSTKYSQQLWLKTNFDALRYTRDQLKLVIEYDQWFTNSAGQAIALLEVLNLGSALETETLKSLQDIIKPELRHYRAKLNEPLLPFVAETYALLAQAATERKIPEELWQIEQAYRQHQDMLQIMLKNPPIQARSSEYKLLHEVGIVQKEASDTSEISNAHYSNTDCKNPKIVIVTEAFPTVTETFILDQITGLIDRGVNVEIWAAAKPSQGVIHQDIIEYQLLKRTKYIKYPTLSEATAEEWTKTFLEINLINDLDHIVAFHIHFGPTFNQLAPLFAVHSDKFVLVSFHGYDASKYFEIMGNDCYDDLFWRADLITTPSHFMKNNLVKKGARAKKIVIHRYGVDLKRFRSKTSVTQNSPIRLLTVGRMVPKKGLEYSIRAFAEIVREYDAVYKIIGEGPLNTHITKLIEDLNIQDKVIVEAFTDKSGIITEMMQADIFVLTSSTALDNDQEGVPVSLIEAHAMGLPVIATFHAGIPELVVDGKTGLLALEKDVKTIAEHMRKLISDEEFRLMLSRNARERVETDFDIEILNDRLWHLLTSRDTTYEAATPLASRHISNSSRADNSNQKSISIIIPTYNRAKFLSQAIASALTQIYPADEILIVDDGSTDITSEIVQAFDLPNIRYIHKDHTGAPDTRNRGVLEAKGDFILWLDSDDILGPKALSRYHQTLENYSDVDIVYCQLQSIDTKGNDTHLYSYHDWYADQQGMLSFLMIGSPVPNGGTLIRKKVFAEVGLYNTEFKRAHDYEFWSRVALAQLYKAKYVEEILYYYRIHDSNITGHLNEHTDYQYEQKILSKLLDRIPLEQLFPTFDWSRNVELAKAEAFFYIAAKYFGWNNVEEGLKYLSESVGLHPVPERMNFLAVQLAQRGNLQEAYKILQEAGRRDPTDKQILENLRIIQAEISIGQTIQQDNQVGDTCDNNAKFANICMVTFNRLEFTQQAIDSITKYTGYPYVLTVVDNNSTDGTQEYLRQLQNQGIIKNLILLPENVGVAKAANIAWHQEPGAEYYVKYDNDIVIQKPNWLSDMVNLIEHVPQLGIVGYNFEPQSYPLIQLNDQAVRPKGNLGGACVLIPKRTAQLVGYWCEEYGLYGEEDADYGVRVQLAGLQNAYMADEDIGLHLPAGKAAKIDPITLTATDGLEEDEHKEYRLWKDEQRRKNVLQGKYQRILSEYQKGVRSLFVQARYYKTWLAQQNQKSLKGDNEQPNMDASTHMKQKVSIIIPVFNKVGFTKKCLEAIYQCTPSRLYFEVIIIDNGSTDKTSSYLNEATKQYPDLRIIRNANNLGFAKACNQGAQTASGNYLLFLNNDTQVQPGWLEPLVKVLDGDPTVAAVGSKLLYPDGTIQHAGVAIFDDKQSADPLLAQHEHQLKSGDDPEVNQTHTYQALTAACLLVRKPAFQVVDGFDEGYWNGYEDVDLCFKFQKHDWHLVYQPESVVIHHESQSGPERFKWVQHNIQRLHEKWLGKIHPDFIIQSDGSRVSTGANRIHPYSFPIDFKNLASQQGLTSIIILTYNQLEHTKLCLNSIEAYTPQPHELIIVDNGSTDGTLDYLRTYEVEHDNVYIIANTDNRGFAAGNNQGVAAARGDYVLLLNNDTVVTEGWLARMLEVFERYPDIGIVGPVSNYVSGLQLVPQAAYQSLEEMHQFATNWAIEHTGQTMEIYRVVGFCLLARREVIDRIGGLDEQFGSGNFEDDDFCIRAALVGFKACIAQDVFIHHTGNQTFKGAGIDYHQSMQRNWELFKAKWDIPSETSLEAGYQLSLEAFNSKQHFIPLPPETKNYRSKITKTSLANTLILFAHEKASTQRLTYCLANLESYYSPGKKLSVKVVNPPTDLSLTSNHFDLNEAIENTPTAALHAALNSGESYVVLLTADVTATENWLDHLITVADSDPTIAAVGPTSNAAPTPQQIKKSYRSPKKDLQNFVIKRANKYGHTWEEVAYLGGFCLLLKSHQVRVVGGLDDSLPLSEALWDLYQRLQQYGFKMVCAQGVYVHHRRLTEQEGATYDAFASNQQVAAKILTAGERALEQGDFDSAIEIFTQMTEQFRHLTAGYIALGSTLLALDRLQEALPYLRQAALLSPQVSAIHNQLGIALYRSGQQTEAEAALQEARRLDPTDIQPLLNLIDLYRAMEDYVAATEMLKAALSLVPDHPDVLVAFGILSLELGDVDGAQQALQHLREASPDHPDIIALQQALDSYQLPDEQTKPTVKPSQPNPSASLEEIRSRVETAQAHENWGQAIELLQDTLKQKISTEDEAGLWNSLGYCYARSSLQAEAEISFKQGIEANPNHIDLLSNLADLYLQQERFDLATEYLNRALAVDPDDTDVLLSLGHCCIQLGVLDTALMTFQRVQALNPGIEGIGQVVAELEALVLVPV